VQIQNQLDLCLQKMRTAELASIADDALRLRESATNMNEAIEDLEMKLQTLRTLAVDVRSLPV